MTAIPGRLSTFAAALETDLTAGLAPVLDSDFLLVTETFNCADTGCAFGVCVALPVFAGSGFGPDFNAAFADILLDLAMTAFPADCGAAAILLEAAALRGGAADFAFAGLSIFAGSFARVAGFFIAFAMDQHKKLLVASSRSVRDDQSPSLD